MARGVDAASRAYIWDRGLPDITHGTGHQIGRSVHDGGTGLFPRWERYGKAAYLPCEEGMVFTLEPTIFLGDGDCNLIVEENVVVTKDGARWLSRRQEELVLIDR